MSRRAVILAEIRDAFFREMEEGLVYIMLQPYMTMRRFSLAKDHSFEEEETSKTLKLTTLILVGNLDGSGVGCVLNWRHFWFGLFGSLKTEKFDNCLCVCKICMR